MDGLRTVNATLAVVTIGGRQCWLRWYQADKDADPFPGWHAFGHPTWESDTPDFVGPGIFRSPLEWRPNAFPAYPGLQFHGKLEWYANGLPEEELKQIVRTDECGRKIIDPRGGIEFGGSAKMLKTAGGLEAGGERVTTGGLDAGGLPVRLGGLEVGGSPVVSGGLECAGTVVQAGGVDLGGEDRATGGVELGGEVVETGGLELGGEDRAVGGVEIGGEQLSIGGEDVGGLSVQAGGVELRGTPSRPGGLDVGGLAALVGGLDVGGLAALVGGLDLGGEEAMPFSGARATLTSPQSVSNNSAHPISWDSSGALYFDTDGYWSAGSPTLFTAPADGYYAVGAGVLWDNNSTGLRLLWLEPGGATDTYVQSGIAAFTGNGVSQLVATVLHLTAGDTVRCSVLQNSTGSLDILGSDSSTNFWIVRLG